MISLVIEQNLCAIVFNEKNKQTARVLLGGGKLVGYTSNSFSIKRGKAIYTYDERGKRIGTKLV